MGRKIKLNISDKDRAFICIAISKSGNVKQVCNEFGITQNTLYHERRKDLEFDQMVSDAIQQYKSNLDGRGWRQCSVCGVNKSHKEFYWRYTNGKQYRFRQCKDCYRERRKG